MKKVKIAIGYNPRKTVHSTNWTHAWEKYCKENEIEYRLVDAYSSSLLEDLKEYDIFLWHYGNYEFQDMLFAKSILYSVKEMGLRVFPDFYTAWHSDDKVAETYLLQAAHAPIPKSEIFYNLNECTGWADLPNTPYPLIAKLRTGSGSHNVKLIKSAKDLKNYAKVMFSTGLNPSPSLMYKTSSNVKSSQSITTFIKRLRRAPEFLRTLRSSQKFPNEKDYVFLQEFIPNEGYDLKVVVVGDKLSFIGRKIRPGEFRASGSGSLFYDKDFITKNILESAFRVADKLKFQCMGYDYVVSKDTGEGKIIEISYGFSHTALLEAGGYFDRQGKWYPEPLNVPDEILKNLIEAFHHN